MASPPEPEQESDAGEVPPRDASEERRALIAEKVAQLPTEPGCYIMRDRRGTIFYIGKAGNLRSRVRAYFSGSDTRQFVCKNMAHGINLGEYATYLNGSFNNSGFGSEHPGGANFTMADGSVRFVSEDTFLGILKGMASRNEGEML